MRISEAAAETLYQRVLGLITLLPHEARIAVALYEIEVNRDAEPDSSVFAQHAKPERSLRGRIEFFGPLCVGLSDVAVAALLAHEVAHAVLFRTGANWRDEAATDALAASWGFDLEALDLEMDAICIGVYT